MTPVERAARVIAEMMLKTGDVRAGAQALADAGMLADGWRPIEEAPRAGKAAHQADDDT